MIIIEDIIGNSRDPEWRDRLAGVEIDWLVLDQWEAQKSRLRKVTSGGIELALSLDRNTHLHDGDILLWNENDKRAVVARVRLKDVMIIDLASVIGENRNAVVRTVFELGHALGNQHWPAVVKQTTVFVPLTVDRKVMASVMKTHNLPGITYAFVPGADVIPYMAPHEARRLFGGAGPMLQSQGHQHGQEHHHDAHSHDQ